MNVIKEPAEIEIDRAYVDRRVKDWKGRAIALHCVDANSVVQDCSVIQSALHRSA